jgi:hypothetical protein
MAGQKTGFTYFRDQITAPATSDVVSGHKALFTMGSGVYVMDSVGSLTRLDDYQLIQDVSAALSASISAHSATVYRGAINLNTTDYVYTITHGDVSVPNTTPLVTISTPTNNSILYVSAVRNRTNTSFDVVLSGVPDDAGYSIDWLVIGDILMGSGTGGASVNLNLLGSGTVVISAQQSIVPTMSAAFDLGTVDKPWRDLHLSGATMYLGGVPISTNGTSLSFNNLYIPTTASPDASAADLTNYVLTKSLEATAANLQAQVNLMTPLATTNNLTGQLTLASTLSTTAANLQAQISAVDSSAVHKTGDETIYGNKSFSNGVTINGNLTINGGTTSVTSQKVLATSNLIVVNNGGVKPIAAGFAGMEVQRGSDISAAYLFVYEEARSGFTVGISGQTQLVATRENTPIVAGLAYWNPSTFRFETTSSLTSGSVVLGSTLTTTASNLLAYSNATSANALLQANSARTTSEALLTPLTTTAGLTGQLLKLSGGTMSGTLNVSSGGISITGSLYVNGVSISGGSSGGSSTLVISTVQVASPSISTNDVTLCNSSSDSGYTATLPTAVGVSGKVYYIKKVDGSINKVRVMTTSSQTIDGTTYFDIYNQYDTLTVVSDGANWQIL